MYSVSKLVETFTGYRILANKPMTTFYTNSGIHADGDNKIIYILMITSERFGRKDNMRWQNFRQPILKPSGIRLKLNQEDLKLVINVLLN
jgi:D-citramalate synthase